MSAALSFWARYPLRLGPDPRPASRGAALSRREEPAKIFDFGGPKMCFFGIKFAKMCGWGMECILQCTKATVAFQSVTWIGRFFTLIYFGFFVALYFTSVNEKTKEVPDRVTMHD